MSGQGKKPFQAPGESKQRRVPIWVRVVIGFLTFCIIVLGGGYWYYEVNIAPIVGNITGKRVAPAHGEQNPNNGKSGSILNWGRVNILLLGSDTDEKPVSATNAHPLWGQNHEYLAQTDIVVSIDTTTHEVDMLSFPRDYWINIPGYGMGKLDQAFSDGGGVGRDYTLPGVDTTRQVFQHDFGIPINFYAWVGLDGFIKVVNTVGGVDVNVAHPIVDEKYPDDVGNTRGDPFAYKGIYIPDGPQHLDGAAALEYVRSRHADLAGDFGRSVRQQQVLTALKLKLNNPNVLHKLPQLAKDLNGSVFTDMDLNKVFDLMRWARSINASQIQHKTLGGAPYSTYGQRDGQDVVLPQCDAIVPAINHFLHMTTATCNISDTGQSGPQVVSPQGRQTPLADTTQPAPGSPTTAQLADASSSGTDLLNMPGDLFGVRALLDLMSMVLLDSPQA